MRAGGVLEDGNVGGGGMCDAKGGGGGLKRIGQQMEINAGRNRAVTFFLEIISYFGVLFFWGKGRGKGREIRHPMG